MSTSDSAARPDLSSLPLDTRMNIALAEVVDGATWSGPASDEYLERWVLDDPTDYEDAPPHEPTWAVVLHDGRVFYDGPDCLNDHAAAWSLMVRETAGVKFDSADAVGLLWRVHTAGGDDVLYLDEFPVPFLADRDAAARRAVALTTLTKHADGPHSPIIRPLLEEARHG
jgi:hypothetical protein